MLSSSLHKGCVDSRGLVHRWSPDCGKSRLKSIGFHVMWHPPSSTGQVVRELLAAGP